MTNQLKHFFLNPWVTLSSFTIGILGVVCSIYFGIKSLQKKKIKVLLKNNELITNKSTKLSKLKVLYDKKNIELLTVTKITFWNSSLPTINNSDIIKLAPFSVSLKTGTILDVSVLKGHNTPNQIDVKLTNNTVQISFDYLDRKEGGIIQIIHTGTEDSAVVSKKLKGGRIIITNPEHNFILLGLFFSILGGFISFLYKIIVSNFSTQINNNLFTSFMTLYMLIMMVPAYLCIKPFTPKNLK